MTNILISEIAEYAVKILGLNSASELHLFHLAKEGLMTQLPDGWVPWYILLLLNLTFLAHIIKKWYQLCLFVGHFNNCKKSNLIEHS